MARLASIGVLLIILLTPVIDGIILFPNSGFQMPFSAVREGPEAKAGKVPALRHGTEMESAPVDVLGRKAARVARLAGANLGLEVDGAERCETPVKCWSGRPQPQPSISPWSGEPARIASGSPATATIIE